MSVLGFVRGVNDVNSKPMTLVHLHLQALAKSPTLAELYLGYLPFEARLPIAVFR
jgi:hypothetical protein